ncbi:MAG: hypothetical protein H6708_03400 [Kofleriaceae bacterium]|nr:hypothetical protein [Kofleriaceae bacterium]
MSSSAAEYPITVFADAPPPGGAAGAAAAGCLAPQNTQCTAVSGSSFPQLTHFFTIISGGPTTARVAPAAWS